MTSLKNKGFGQVRKCFVKELARNLDLLGRMATLVSKTFFLGQEVLVSKKVLKGKIKAPS